MALFLPYTVEFTAESGETARYDEIAHALNLAPLAPGEGAALLAAAIRRLERSVGQPLTLREAGIDPMAFEAELDALVENAMNDTQTLMAARIPDEDEMHNLFRAAL